MSIPITCGSCNRSFNVKDHYAGKIGSCPFCSGTVRVPRPQPQIVPAEFDALAEDDDEISICDTNVVDPGRSLLNTVQVVHCTQCGRRNLGGMSFCVSCGGKLEVATY